MMFVISSATLIYHVCVFQSIWSQRSIANEQCTYFTVHCSTSYNGTFILQHDDLQKVRGLLTMALKIRRHAAYNPTVGESQTRGLHS